MSGMVGNSRRLVLSCRGSTAFFTSGVKNISGIHSGIAKMCLTFLLNNVYIRFGTKLYTNCKYSDGYQLCSHCSRFIFVLL